MDKPGTFSETAQDYSTEIISPKDHPKEWAQFFDLIKNTQSLETQWLVQIWYIKYISKQEGNDVHILKNDTKNVIGWYILSKNAPFVMNRKENKNTSRGNDFMQLKTDGYKHLSYELIERQDENPELLIPLLENISQKVYMIVTDKNLESKLLDGDWEEVLGADGKPIYGTKRPHLKYIKYNPDNQENNA